MTTLSIKQIVEELGLDDKYIHIAYLIDDEDLPDLTQDKIEEIIQTAIDEIQVIHYGTAIDFLAKNDPSLRDSMALASDMGFNISNINSELLATLLKQDICRTSLCNAASDIYDAIQEKLNEEEQTNEN